jgi:multiple sugar transport system ATP-binding protein
MTVGANIGFALKMRKMPKDEIKKRVSNAAEILGLTEWIGRKPGLLSGGQRQRVAMGRAIVREPSVFLMDEPLSNLDAKLRAQMRAEVARIQRSLDVATLYVTHDQVEAMTMGDRVAVLRSGVLQQCDSPQVIYDSPVNLFVAGFMGSPAMNFFEAELAEGVISARVGSQTLTIPESVHRVKPGLRAFSNCKVIIGIRPEDLYIVGEEASSISNPMPFEGDIDLVEALGSELLIHFTTDARKIVNMDVAEPEADGLSKGTLVRAGEGIARVKSRSQLVAGQRVRLVVDPDRLHFFDPNTNLAIVG